MSTLVFDIETAPMTWDDIKPSNQEALLKNQSKEEAIDNLGLSPLTGFIVSLAMYDVERELGAVYFISDETQETVTDQNFTYKVRKEEEIIKDFWVGARSYDTFVTFNGRAFVLPFLYHRSAIWRAQPSIDISKKLHLEHQTMPYHVDLLDQLTFYGNFKPRPALSLLAEAYGVQHEPEIKGSEVSDYFKQKDFQVIANKNVADVATINSLFSIWKQYHAPRQFLNQVEL